MAIDEDRFRCIRNSARYDGMVCAAAVSVQNAIDQGKLKTGRMA